MKIPWLIQNHQYDDSNKFLLALIMDVFSAKILHLISIFDKGSSAHIFACLAIVNFLQTSTLLMWIFNVVRIINPIKVCRHIFYGLDKNAHRMDQVEIEFGVSEAQCICNIVQHKMRGRTIGMTNFITTINTNSIKISKFHYNIYVSHINWKVKKKEKMAMLGFSYYGVNDYGI